jgi:aspartyl-tRNA(Asn)/glutamyl-tRNA(Gln) amidotransferase subunit B
MLEKYLVKGKYLPTIGVECHVQLKTKTKLFSGVSNDARDAEPNTLISPICLGFPGTLPVLNKQAIHLAVKAGIALRAKVANVSHFDRKHYFYPDLPKGYQITQFERPIVGEGVVEAPMGSGEFVKVGITRAHLEEDAGKSSHPAGADYSLVDLNRAGTPLLEIVSEPDIHSALEAKAYAHELYLLMKYAEVSDVDLYHGNMRFDVNVSVSDNLDKLGTRSETKNLNSFKSVEKAVEYEINRQIELLEKGQVVVQETRGWDDAKQKTISQRSKEDAHDYRYFPDPDLPPVEVEQAYIDAQVESMPTMPSALRVIFADLGLNEAQIDTIIEEPEMANILRQIQEEKDLKTAKIIGNWLTGELQRHLTENEITIQQIAAVTSQMVALASMLDSAVLSSTAAKEVLLAVVKTGHNPEEIAKSKNLLQVSDESELVMIVEQVISENQKAAEDVRGGEMKAIGFLVGQVMKQSQGRANPAKVQELLKKQLGV